MYQATASRGVVRIEATVGEKPAVCRPAFLSHPYIKRLARKPSTNGETTYNSAAVFGSMEGSDLVRNAIM
jgi:hypothetical protein